MICSVCGNEYTEGSVCPVCGQAVTAIKEDPGKNLGLISLILGAVALFTSLFAGGGGVIPMGCGIAGLICGIKGGKDSAAAGFENKNAKTGKILSVISLVLMALFTILSIIIVILVYVFSFSISFLPFFFMEF